MAKRKRAETDVSKGQPVGDPPDRGSREESIGYKNPPRKHRWKQGCPSPNPRGRPRGSESLTTILKRELDRRYPITEGGRRKNIKALEFIITQAVTDTMKGRVKAFDRLIAMIRYAGMFEDEPQSSSERTLTPEEQAIIAAFFEKKSA